MVVNSLLAKIMLQNRTCQLDAPKWLQDRWFGTWRHLKKGSLEKGSVSKVHCLSQSPQCGSKESPTSSLTLQPLLLVLPNKKKSTVTLRLSCAV